MSEPSSARRFRFHPHAGAEYAEEVEYLTVEDRNVAERFEAEIDHAIGQLLQHPEIGTLIGRPGGGLRKWRIHGFRFSLIYLFLDDAIGILAVAHHSRRPGYWLYRLHSL